MTVSRVVNGGSYVSPATEKRVRAAIRRLGYTPNEAARMLKGQRARMIGLVVPDLADSFFATCANAVQQVAGTHGVDDVAGSGAAAPVPGAADRDPSGGTEGAERFGEAGQSRSAAEEGQSSARVCNRAGRDRPNALSPPTRSNSRRVKPSQSR